MVMVAGQHSSSTAPPGPPAGSRPPPSRPRHAAGWRGWSAAHAGTSPRLPCWGRHARVGCAQANGIRLPTCLHRQLAALGGGFMTHSVYRNRVAHPLSLSGMAQHPGSPGLLYTLPHILSSVCQQVLSPSSWPGCAFFMPTSSARIFSPTAASARRGQRRVSRHGALAATVVALRCRQHACGGMASRRFDHVQSVPPSTGLMGSFLRRSSSALACNRGRQQGGIIGQCLGRCAKIPGNASLPFGPGIQARPLSHPSKQQHQAPTEVATHRCLAPLLLLLLLRQLLGQPQPPTTFAPVLLCRVGG